MSTSYYRLREPFTSLRLEKGPTHDRLTVWEEHANAGTLTVRGGWGKHVALLFALQEGDEQCPVRTHWGGVDRGAVVTFRDRDKDLPDEIVLVSEYGDVVTVGYVRARDGAKRSDGWPTELFGYEQKTP